MHGKKVLRLNVFCLGFGESLSAGFSDINSARLYHEHSIPSLPYESQVVFLP